MIFTSALLPAFVNASETPFTSRLASIKTSSADLHVTRLQLYAIPHAAPSVPRGAAHAPAMQVPWPQPSSGVSAAP